MIFFNMGPHLFHSKKIEITDVALVTFARSMYYLFMLH
jgi:hypothetical protein